ncbi:MFS transporter [Falsiroseomonas bella]|uniref:MFS transporter n=1 Tax=Falsiroseomonas bella TaxID=2184016 RepID=A0A317FMD8_9PROT|nr:MFS transporter [Falsiroseomonas bella]PWS39129.1 MFS transporter [Falsiroseomonas bella]
MADPAPATLPLWRQPPFLLFLSSRVLSAFALQMQVVAVGWQVYALTDSAFALGLIGLVQFVPMLLLTPVTGLAADRLDRRAVTAACRAANGLAAAALAAGSLAGWLDAGWIFAIVALFGATRAFEMPASQALLASVVATKDLARANALAASTGQAATIAGPAAGGLLYAAGGPAAPYAGVAALALLSAVLVLLIRMAAQPRPRGRVTLEVLLSGLVFLRARPALMGAVTLDMVAVLIGGAAALLPVYARDILDAGPWGLGILRSALAVGGLAASLWLAWRPLGRRAGRSMLRAVALFGAGTVVFGLSESLALSVLALALVGAADVVSVVVRQSLVQLGTPDEMRGRVAAVNSLFIGTSNQLGEFYAGSMAALLGPVAAVVLGGFGTMTVVLLWMRWFPALRAVDRLEDVTPHQSPGHAAMRHTLP